MELPKVGQSSPKGSPIAGFSIGAFMARNTAMAKFSDAKSEMLATLQQKAAAGDRAAKFSLGIRSALGSQQ